MSIGLGMLGWLMSMVLGCKILVWFWKFCGKKWYLGCLVLVRLRWFIIWMVVLDMMCCFILLVVCCVLIRMMFRLWLCLVMLSSMFLMGLLFLCGVYLFNLLSIMNMVFCCFICFLYLKILCSSMFIMNICVCVESVWMFIIVS